MTLRSLELASLLLSYRFSTLFQITMPICQKIENNCTWHVPLEWHGLNLDSAFLIKVYWNYATHIVRVCVSSKSPINPNLHLNEKSNLQIHFGSKAMHSLYELLCHHSLTCSEPSPISLLDFLHTSSIISIMKALIMNQFIQLIHLFLHFIPMIRPIFLENFLPCS